MNTLLGTKLSMTQRYVETGVMKTVTIVSIKPHVVAGKKNQEKHGYEALVIGTGVKKKPIKALSSSHVGLDTVPLKTKEVRGTYSHEVGQTISVSDVLKPGDIVKVVGVSKGKGFTGVVKRHHFAGGPKTHGQSDRHRAPGSIGAGTDPGRVFKGMRMAGRSGGAQATVRNIVVLHVDDASGMVYLSGPVPGHYSSNIEITKIGEKSSFSPMVVTEAEKYSVVNLVESSEIVEDTAEVKEEEK